PPAWQAELSRISPPRPPRRWRRPRVGSGTRQRRLLTWLGAAAAVLVVVTTPVLVRQGPWSSGRAAPASAAGTPPTSPQAVMVRGGAGAGPMEAGEVARRPAEGPRRGGTGPTTVPSEEPERSTAPAAPAPAPPAPVAPPAPAPSSPPPTSDTPKPPKPDPKPTRTTPPPGWSVTVDNSSSRFSASSNWRTLSLPGQYGANVRYATPVEASDPAWYRINIPATGKYRVEVWFPAHRDNNDRTPYIVATTSGHQTIHVNQRSGGGQWVSLGVFTLAAGDAN